MVCIRIGTAGWPLPAAERKRFPPGASLLARYAGRFNAVEINSSFYRSHRRATYERWADSVPENFAFSAKLPREITHVRKLRDGGELIRAFAAESAGLGSKLEAVLVQLPPSLRFDAVLVRRFFIELQHCLAVPVLCEPRHASWFSGEADTLLAELLVARVGADPAPADGAALPAGAAHTAYLRLHGSPRMYYSEYDPEALLTYAKTVRSLASNHRNVWCIFDNTAEFAATSNALDLIHLLDHMSVSGRPEPDAAPGVR